MKPLTTIDQIKLTLKSNDIEKYDESFKELEKHFHSKISDNSIDTYCIKSIEIFFTPEYGFPQEIYKGEDKNYVQKIIHEMVRDLKRFISELCKENPDKKIGGIETNVRDATILFFVEELCKKSGLNDFFVKLYVYSLAQFCRIKAMERICSAIEG